MPTIDKLTLTALVDEHGLDGVLDQLARLAGQHAQGLEMREYWEAQRLALLHCRDKLQYNSKIFK